jgi:hypothetical protein
VRRHRATLDSVTASSISKDVAWRALSLTVEVEGSRSCQGRPGRPRRIITSLQDKEMRISILLKSSAGSRIGCIQET